MKKIFITPYISAILLIIISSLVSGKVTAIQNPFLMVTAAVSIIVAINIASILFYISFNSETKIVKTLFSIVNLLIFLFLSLFAVETVGHFMI